MKKLDSSIDLGARDGIERVSPLISFAYLQGGHAYAHSREIYLSDFVQNTPEQELIRKLDAYPEEGLIIRNIKRLPVRPGLRKRTRGDFILRTETFMPKDIIDETGYSPIISTVSVGASHNYPSNRTGNAKNARADVCKIGRMIVNAGLNMAQISEYCGIGEKVVPFWMKANWIFVKDKKEICADGWTWDHMEFLEILRDWEF